MRSLKDHMPVRLCDLCHGAINEEAVVQLFTQDIYEFGVICWDCHRKIRLFIEELSNQKSEF